MKKEQPELPLSRPAAKCLGALLMAELAGTPAEIAVWHVQNAKQIPRVDELTRAGMLEGRTHYAVTFWGLLNVSTEQGRATLDRCERLFKAIRKLFPKNPKSALDLANVAKQSRLTEVEALQCAHFLSRSVIYLGISHEENHQRRLIANENYVTWRGFDELKEKTREEARRVAATRLAEGPTTYTGLLANLATSESVHIRDLWLKATERLTHDSSGAITAARSLLETACKYILEEHGEAIDAGLDLPRLYKKAAAHLRLDPHRDIDEPLRRILQACATLVDGLAQLRNRVGDAHGTSSKAGKPARRHAEFSVLVAAATTAFLLSTLEAQRIP